MARRTQPEPEPVETLVCCMSFAFVGSDGLTHVALEGEIHRADSEEVAMRPDLFVDPSTPHSERPRMEDFVQTPPPPTREGKVDRPEVAVREGRLDRLPRD